MIKAKEVIAVSIFLLCSIYSINIDAQNIELDKKLGQEAAKQIENEMGIYSYKITSDYVKNVGERLIENINPVLFNYNFQVVEMKEPNAFALPGGHIYISRGLLCLLNNEDELAGILGHEIAHSELRHSVKQMRRGIIPALLQLPGEVVGVVVNENLGQIINSPLNTSSQLFLASYSRKHEKQADKYGTRLMAATGYNPEHFPIVLNNLTSLLEVLTGEKEEFGYFDSHPYTPKRVKYLNDEIKKISPAELPGITENKLDFLNQMSGICVGVNPANGIFNENNFLHPELDIFVSFPKGWATDNQPNVVGAIDTVDNKSMVVIGISDKDKMPDEIGKEFLQGLKEQYNVKPEKAESIDFKGMPAYLVALKDSTGGEVIGIYSLWFRINDITFQMLGLAKKDNLEQLKNTALSIRSLTIEERKSIEMLVLRIEKAKEGESIDEFNARTGNCWKTDITAVINSIDAATKLTEGQILKIAVKEKYIKDSM